MNQPLLRAIVLSATCLAGSAFASTHREAPGAMAASGASAPAMGKQQTKMADCNQSAGDKKGDDRKAYMKTCLSAKKPATQQDKMKSCNADPKAKTLKGDERKSYMKECLSA